MAYGTKESTIIATIRSREIYFIHNPSDPKTGETRTRAGMQVYRIEGGKLAETWADVPRARLGMARRRCAGAPDEPAACKVGLCC